MGGRLLTNPIFVAGALSWFTAQLIKTVLDVLRGDARTVPTVLRSFLWRTGGMPSSHSALVTSLAISIGFSTDVDDPVFVLSVFFALVVLRDAMGVRRAAGQIARSLNELGSDHARRNETEWASVREVQGHTPLEVGVGVGIGALLSLATVWFSG